MSEFGHRRPSDGDDALRGAIDASLRRQFTPPPELLLKIPEAPREAPLLQWPTWLPLAGLAAAVLFVVRLQSVEPVSTVEIARSPAGSLVRVPLRTDGTSRALTVLDLEGLYARLAGDPSSDACSSDEEMRESGMELANMFEARYGDKCLDPQAAEALHGPFPADEWPSGTVFTAFVQGQPVVVVAEFESRLACCLRLDLPRESELSLYTERCGDLLLTEISPFGEPRLLQLFGP